MAVIFDERHPAFVQLRARLAAWAKKHDIHVVFCEDTGRFEIFDYKNKRHTAILPANIQAEIDKVMHGLVSR